MNSITIFYKDRKILLLESTPELEIKIESLEIDEPFQHKCNDRMSIILNNFFENDYIKEISFEHCDLEKLIRDFKSQFTFIEAAGGLVRNKDNELLVIHRFGKPDLPKGKIEPNESPQQAAIREVEEECGIHDPVIVSETELSYHIYFVKSQRFLKKTYWFNMHYSGNEILIPQQKEAIVDAEWCDNRKVKNYQMLTYPSIMKHFV